MLISVRLNSPRWCHLPNFGFCSWTLWLVNRTRAPWLILSRSILTLSSPSSEIMSCLRTSQSSQTSFPLNFSCTRLKGGKEEPLKSSRYLVGHGETEEEALVIVIPSSLSSIQPSNPHPSHSAKSHSSTAFSMLPKAMVDGFRSDKTLFRSPLWVAFTSVNAIEQLQQASSIATAMATATASKKQSSLVPWALASCSSSFIFCGNWSRRENVFYLFTIHSTFTMMETVVLSSLKLSLAFWYQLFLLECHALVFVWCKIQGRTRSWPPHCRTLYVYCIYLFTSRNGERFQKTTCARLFLHANLDRGRTRGDCAMNSIFK